MVATQEQRPLRTFLVEEKKHGLWAYRALARDAKDALRQARACGLTEPAKVTDEGEASHG